MELPRLAERYLAGVAGEAAADLRVAKRVLEQVLDEFAAAARRAEREKDAALMRRQAAHIREAVEAPSLEEFAERFPPDFYGEAELIELYQAEYGQAASGGQAAAAQKRRARLIDRQLALIADIEERFVEPLRLGSPIAQWFAPSIAQRLHEAGIVLVAQLVERIRGLWCKPPSPLCSSFSHELKAAR